MQQVNDAPRRAPRCVWSTFEKRHTTTYATTSAIANVRCNSPKTAGSAVPEERKSGVKQDGEEPGEAERGAHDPRYEIGIHVEPSVLLRTSPLGAARAFHLLRMHIASSRFHDVVPSEKQYTVKRAGKGKLFI